MAWSVGMEGLGSGPASMAICAARLRRDRRDQADRQTGCPSSHVSNPIHHIPLNSEGEGQAGDSGGGAGDHPAHCTHNLSLLTLTCLTPSLPHPMHAPFLHPSKHAPQHSIYAAVNYVPMFQTQTFVCVAWPCALLGNQTCLGLPFSFLFCLWPLVLLPLYICFIWCCALHV